jgi:hypothetical protein
MQATTTSTTIKDANDNITTITYYRDNILEQIEYYEFEDNTGKTYVNSDYEECPIANIQLVKVERYENGKMVEKILFSYTKKDTRYRLANSKYARHYKIK